MIFLDRKDIDTKKWDEVISKSNKQNIFCYSWYLDACCDNWGGIISKDYSFILPLPYAFKFQIPQVAQHIYSRQIDYFGDNERAFNQAIELLKTKFRFVNISLSLQEKSNFHSKVFQVLHLNKEIKYKENATRILKKYYNNYTFDFSTDFSHLISFYKRNAAIKLKINKSSVNKLETLLNNLHFNKKGVCIYAKMNNEIVAGAFFMTDKKTVTYLIGDCDDAFKKQGAMYSLINFAIDHYKASYDIFDFGGSNVNEVASFYKKMGGIDKKYSNIIFDNLPWWYKKVKALKNVS